MKEEADEHVERHPRQIEQRRRTRARQEYTHLIEVTQRLQSVAAGTRQECQPPDDRVHPQAKAVAERAADANQHPPAQEVEKALKSIEDSDQNGETDKRWDAPAGQQP